MNENRIETKKITNFTTKLNQYKRNLRIKEKIHESWLGVVNEVNLIGKENNNKVLPNPFLNGNITMNVERKEHKKDLSYYYKRIINFIYQENAREDKDKNRVSLVFNKTLFSDENDKIDFSEKKQKNIYDFVTFDENTYAKSIQEITIGKFIYSIPFQTFLAVIVLLNLILLAIQAADNSIIYKYQTNFEIFTNCVFLMELFLKWYYGFRVYWYSAWNVFDFIVVVFSLIQFYTNAKTRLDKKGSTFIFMRIVRALRSLRSISIFYNLQVLVESIIKSTFDILNIVLLMLLTMVMLTIIACNIFRDHEEKYFENLEKGMMSLFYCATGEGLTDLFEAITSGNYLIPWRAFIIFSIIILAFILTNLIVAVVVTNMEQALKEKDEKEKIERQLKLIEGHEEVSNYKDIDNLFADKLKILKCEEIVSGMRFTLLKLVEIINFKDFHGQFKNKKKIQFYKI
jgi:voltage-gated sodium channel